MSDSFHHVFENPNDFGVGGCNGIRWAAPMGVDDLNNFLVFETLSHSNV